MHYKSSSSGSKIGSHIRAISGRIATINALIDEELRRPLPDQLRLTHLKRGKISLKDQMTRIITDNRHKNDSTSHYAVVLKRRKQA